ncbi:MAG: cation diffusion facilitator family transporter [Polyangiaceae bacterium]
MDHDHAHSHDRSHAHGGTNDRAFIIGIVLNFGIVVLEVAYGVVSHSLALLADAGHNLGDVLGLGLAAGAAVLARRKPTRTRTYGFRRLTLLSALLNAIVLLVATGAIALESVQRIFHPEPVAAKTVIVVAAITMVVNGASALLFLRDRHHDLNVQGAFLHLAGDAAIALGVVVANIVIWQTGWSWLDPVTSLVVGFMILVGTWSLLRKSIDLVLDAVPEGIDVDAIRAYLAALPRVSEVHDLHVWATSSTENALTAHLVMPTNSCEPCFLGDVCKELHDRFDIDHTTLQVDAAEAPDPCRLAPTHKKLAS